MPAPGIENQLPLKPLVFNVLLADGIIEESARTRAASEDERRRYFRLTRFGAEVAAAEALRLEAVVMEARSKRLLARSRS